MKLPEFREGQRLNARECEQLRQELIRLGRVTATLPLTVDSDDAGFRFALDEPQPITIKLTGGGTAGKYSWTKVNPTPGGGWSADTQSGSASDDPAIEANGNATIPTSGNGTVILRALRDRATGELRFERGTC